MIQVTVTGHTQSHNIKKDIKGSGTNNIAIAYLSYRVHIDFRVG